MFYLFILWLYQNQFLQKKRIEMKNQTSKGSQYKYSQIFGYKGPNQKILQDDIITSVKFDSDGKMIALGDKAGRIIIFKAEQQNKKGQLNFEYFSQFQSHLREFDPLRSIEVQEDIVDINWLKPQGKYLKMATTNAKSIKIWKIFEKAEKKVVKSINKELNIPKLKTIQTNYVAQNQKQFPNKHISSINSFSPSCNQEYMLSSDEAQIFMWSMQKPEKPYVVCDFLAKGSNIEDLKQTINCSKMHSQNDSLFLYGMNKGTVSLADLRVSSNVQKSSLNFKVQTSSAKTSYIYELISSISSLSFMNNNKYIVSRDYLTVKIWDICNNKKPISTFLIQQNLKSKLCQMIENECIFDKFKLAVSPDSNTILTGNYNNNFHLIDVDGTNTQYQVNYKKTTISRPIVKGSNSAVAKMDYQKKLLPCDFNPKKNIMAVASLNCFFTYSL